MATQQRFTALIPNTYDYALGKLHKGIACDYPLAGMNLGAIKDTHASINQALIARYGSLRSAPGGDSAFQITYILDRFTHWVSQHCLAGNEDAYVFLTALEAHGKALFEVLHELDETN